MQHAVRKIQLPFVMSAISFMNELFNVANAISLWTSRMDMPIILLLSTGNQRKKAKIASCQRFPMRL